MRDDETYRMPGVKQRFYAQVQVCGMQSKMQNGGTADERKTNLRILAFKHIKGLEME